MGTQSAQVKLDGCVASYNEGGIISVTSDRDPTDRLVWTPGDAEAAARIFRHVAPGLGKALRELAVIARLRKMGDRKGADE